MNILDLFKKKEKIPVREQRRRQAISEANKQYFRTHGRTRKVKVNGINESYYIHLPIITEKERKQARDKKGRYAGLIK